MNSYFIKPGYEPRLNPLFFNDTALKDEWQNEVYVHARRLADDIEPRFTLSTGSVTTVVDFGCGSGYKLLKYFPQPPFLTIGIDLEPTVSWLQQAYPEREWHSACLMPPSCDILIVADVIEHMLNPDDLLDFIAAANPQYAVISTPDRDLLDNPDGPPRNQSHVREWSFDEFERYIGSRFTIVEHFISNKEQWTQVVVVKVRV